MNKRLKGYVFYSQDDKIIPGSLILRASRPKTNRKFIEISGTLCCGPDFLPVIAAPNWKGLRAFVRIAANGMVVPGSVIVRRQRPKTGKFVEIPYMLCCGGFASLPEITTQPLPLTIPLGDDSQQLTVVATGTGTLTYQWYKDGVAIAPGTLYLSGQTTDTLTIAPNSVGLTGEYYVIVTDDIGSTQSNTVQVTVE